MKEGFTKTAVNFLISDLLKRALMKHKKKRTDTSVHPEEDPGAEDHGKPFLTFWWLLYLHVY